MTARRNSSCASAANPLVISGRLIRRVVFVDLPEPIRHRAGQDTGIRDADSSSSGRRGITAV